MESVQPSSNPRGEATREALILSALQAFSAKGFDSVSTRELATLAKVNQALINYHFGSKKGLYLAVFEHIVDKIKTHVWPQIEAIMTMLQTHASPLSATKRQEIYLPPLLGIIDAILTMMLEPETKLWSQLILREQSRPTEAFDYIYESYIKQVVTVITELILKLDDKISTQEAKFTVIGIIGQLFVWRAAEASAMRVLQRDSFDEKTIAQIKQSVRKNIMAQLFHPGKS